MDELRSDDPRWIGGYRLLGRLGAGGMGRVYLARSPRGRTVAVKVVRAELAEQEEFRGRFRREVAAARRVGGPWTAPLIDADTEADVPWLATGYVAGPSLQQVVARDHGPLPVASVRVLADGLTRALADIHGAGLVHRDLKPSNVMLTIDGPRVIDFGIARALETVADDGSITYTGAMVGSPAFMSPEQVRGDRVTPACDIFCMGSVLAFAATGLQPFGAASSGVHAQMFRIVQEPPDLDAVPEELRGLVAACLAKDPEERPSLTDVRRRLAAIAPPAPDGDTGADSGTGSFGATGSGAGAGARAAAEEPWLPAAVVARLGRQAVRLLELEEAETGSLPVITTPEPQLRPEQSARPASQSTPAPRPPAEPWPQVPPRPEPVADLGTAYPAGPAYRDAPTPAPGRGPAQAGAGPTVPPRVGPAGPAAFTGHASPAGPAGLAAPTPFTGPAGPAGPGGPGLPERSGAPRRRRRVLVAVAGVLVVAAAAVAAVVARGSGGGSGGGPTAAPSTHASAAASARASAPADASAAAGDLHPPADMVGTWRTSFDGGDATAADTRVLTVHADGTVELTGDGPSYSCAWSMHVTSAGPPVALSPSQVTRGSATSCLPGGATTLTLVDADHLRRDNVDSGRSPLTYEKTGG